MKVAFGEKHIVASQGIVNQSGFRIQASAHAYKILSDGLYSDKQSAVLREIGCNANDAHIAAGRPDLPIEVKLPTTLSPDMYIKDFGPGLSDEEVRGLYTTYFSSTKQDSNDFTGAFGLGSKSPFSYTDSFTVVSVKEGVERTYTATIDDEGVPMMALMNEKPASAEWPHGVLVGFAVPPRDFAEFERKAKDVFQWFTVKPNIAGIPAARLTPKFTVDTPTFSFNGRDEGALACVIMGNVRYPLDASKLNYTCSDAVDRLAVSLLGQGIHLRLPIGTVQVAASREQLQYDKGSKPALIEALRAAALEFSRMVNAVARAPSPSVWEKHVACQTFVQHFTVDMRKVVEQAILVSETDEDQAARSKLLFATQVAALPSEAGEMHLGKHFVVMGYHENEKTHSASRKSIYGGGFFRGNDRVAYTAGYLSGFAIYVNDAKYSDKRMRQLILTTRVKSSVMVTPDSDSSIEDARAYAELLSATMGGAPISTVSSLPEPEKRAKTKRAPGYKKPLVASKGRVNVIYISEQFNRQEMPALHSEPLDTVVDEAKYFLVKGAGAGGNASYIATPGFQVTLSCTSMKNAALNTFVKGMRILNATTTQLEIAPIRGFIVVSESAVKRLKLEALGFRPLVVAANVLAQTPAVAAAFEKGTRGLPFVGASESGHAVDCLVHAVRHDKDYAAVARRVMQGKPLEALIFEDLPLVKSAESLTLRGHLTALNGRFAALNLPQIKVSAVEMTDASVKALFDEAFPLSSKVTPMQVVASLKDKVFGEVFLQQVFITHKDIELIKALKSQQASDTVLLKAAA